MAGTKKDPAFLHSATTWLQSRAVNGLSLEQQGAHMRLLCFSWLHGSISDDPEELRHMLGLGGDAEAFERIWSRLSTRWSKKPGTPGQLINERQEDERAERAAKAEEMRVRGAAGGQQTAKQGGSRDPSRGAAGPPAERQAEPQPSTSTSRMDGRMDGGCTSSQKQSAEGIGTPVLRGGPETAGSVARRVVGGRP